MNLFGTWTIIPGLFQTNQTIKIITCFLNSLNQGEANECCLFLCSLISDFFSASYLEISL